MGRQLPASHRACLRAALSLLFPGDSPLQSNVATLSDAFILADDIGWQVGGFHGAELGTPHIDRIAAGGIELHRSPARHECSPIHAALVAGSDPIRRGRQRDAATPWAEPPGCRLKVRAEPVPAPAPCARTSPPIWSVPSTSEGRQAFGLEDV